MEQETRTCQNCKTPFVIDEDDQNFYKQLEVPPPTFCWLCRAERRMAWRNERSLFKRKSDFSGPSASSGQGRDIFSAFSPDAPVTVYEKEVWLTDQWDPMTYGRDVEFSRPFLEQFRDLLHVVPLKNLNVVNAGVDTDYVNNFTDPKNCYLTFNGKGGEDCMYGNGITHSKECVDTSNVGKSEKCYESFWLTSCSGTFFSSQCENSYNLAFSKDCVGCNDCFGCVGLRRKSYCLWNEQFTKEEYAKRLATYNLGSYRAIEELKARAKALWLTFPVKYIEGYQNTGVSGNYIDHSKNVRQSFLIRESENLRYCQYVQELPGSRYCYDYTAWGDSNEFIYECSACGIGTNRIKFCYNVQENVHDIEYSYMCSGSSDLFGCVGLRKKQYCILNKQYEKGEYEALVKKIKESMDAMPYTDAKGRVYKYGEFFPIELSPFAYNETLAQEYFPKTKEEALAEGYTWRDAAEKNYVPTVAAHELPDNINDVQDRVTGEVIGCLHDQQCNDQCTGAFRIVPQELQFYRKVRLPLPRLCPSCRHAVRNLERSKLQLYPRTCQCAGSISANGAHKNLAAHSHATSPCPNRFETSYPPERPEIIYCEACYQAEVA